VEGVLGAVKADEEAAIAATEKTTFENFMILELESFVCVRVFELIDLGFMR
jgi:hypothetical protein